MSTLTSENLFLLEFMIVDIQLDGKFKNGTPPGELCASFQFLDNPPVSVCDADFGDRDDDGNRSRNQKNIRNGKSCLFSLTEEQIQNALDLFIVAINVYKKMKCGWEPDRCDIGEALVHLEGCFNEVVNNQIEGLSVERPKVQTLKNSFDILDNEQTTNGRIDVYIRLTCLGKSIVTQFQMNLEDRSILFKNKDGTSVCKYKKSDGEDRTQQEDMRNDCYRNFYPGDDMGRNMGNYNTYPPPYNMANANANCPNIPCGNMDRSNQTGQGQLTPCIECGNLVNAPCAPPPTTPCIECGELPNPPCAGVSQSEMDKTMPPPSSPPGNYKIIETSMGPNRLIIRMHKDGGNKIEKIGSSGDCCCTSDTLNQTGTTTTQYKNTVTGNSPFTLKMPGTSGSDGMAINPPTFTKPDGTVMTEVSDPNRDMYVLRIGKKGKGKGKNDKFDLEFCTPRLLQDQQRN